MSTWKDRRAPLAAALVIGCCAWLRNGLPAAAESNVDDRRPLIVLADARDAELVCRIGGDVIAVESLFPSDATTDSAEYDACNARALSVRAFSVYLANARTLCPRERFWRERLSRANPSGQVCLIGGRPATSEHDSQRAARQATDIHRALAKALPRYRQTFDANLREELVRLGRLRCESRLASSEERRFTAFTKEHGNP